MKTTTTYHLWGTELIEDYPNGLKIIKHRNNWKKNFITKMTAYTHKEPIKIKKLSGDYGIETHRFVKKPTPSELNKWKKMSREELSEILNIRG